jgi:carbon monoxide dehydrogenase subunit G
MGTGVRFLEQNKNQYTINGLGNIQTSNAHIYLQINIHSMDPS